MSSWIVWLIVAAVLGVAELLTTTLAFGLIAVAAVVAAVVGAFHLGLAVQLAAFVVAAGAGLGLVRPIAMRHIKQPPLLRTGTAALVGRSAIVLEEITEHSGRIRIGGEEWSSRSLRRVASYPGRRQGRRHADRRCHRPRLPSGVAMLLGEGVIGAIVAILVVITVMRSVRIVPQARARNVERLGRYRKTLEPGMNFVIPMINRVKPMIDLREQVVSFAGAPVITEDNLVVLIDTVLFFQVTDPRAADYEIVNYIQAIEQITATMLRSVIGSMDLEQTLTSRDKINALLRGVLDDASGKWGIRVTRVEIKAIDPPKSVKDAMEKQMRAEREKRAAILTAEGVRQSKILTAEGEKQSAILTAEGVKQAKILTAEGEAQAIGAVFQAVHDNDPDPKLLAYQYLQTLPQIAQGSGNTFWVIPSEITSALRSVANAFGVGDEAPAAGRAGRGRTRREPPAVPAGSAAAGDAPALDPAPPSGGAPAANGTAASDATGSGLSPERPSGDRRRAERHARLGHPRDQLRRPAGVHRSRRPRSGGVRGDPGQRPVRRQRQRSDELGRYLRSSTSALPISAAMTMTASSRTEKNRSLRRSSRWLPVACAADPAELSGPRRGGRSGSDAGRGPLTGSAAEVVVASADAGQDADVMAGSSARGVGAGGCISAGAGRPRGRRGVGRLDPEMSVLVALVGPEICPFR